jgi:predicted SAM-dependent methyltransferase
MDRSTRTLAEQAAYLEARRPSVLKGLVFSLQIALCDKVLRTAPKLRNADNLLNLGSGPCRMKGWVTADLYRLHDALFHRHKLPDWMLDITRPWKCADNIWDGIFTQHCLEHLSYSGALTALREAHRTLKPGGWMRVVVPDLAKFVRNYVERGALLPELPPAMAMSELTQSWAHLSVWDAELMREAMESVGFHDVKEVAFGIGTDPRLLIEDAALEGGSFYIEGQK